MIMTIQEDTKLGRLFYKPAEAAIVLTARTKVSYRPWLAATTQHQRSAALA